MNLFKHQQEALDLASKHNSFALFMDTGTGKTRVAIELIRLRMPCRILIVCPLSIIGPVWEQELHKWSSYRLINLRTNKNIMTGPGIYIINYESLKNLDKNFIDSIDFMILDESSKIKNINAKVTKFLIGQPSGSGLHLCDSIKHKLILTGTPAPNNLLEYWPQVRFVNKDIFDTNFYAFRNTYFYNPNNLSFVWAAKKSTRENITNLLKQISYVADKNTCLDLPDQVFITRNFDMQESQKNIYINMLRHNIAEIQNKKILSPNQLAKIMKLRQITSGFIFDEQGFISNISDSKLDLLEDLIQELGNKQLIIWAVFNYDIERILKLLSKLSISSRAINGLTSQESRQEYIEKFINNKIQALVCHPRTAGYGLNLTNCSYNIYYSLDYSYENYKQSLDRTYRIGQTNKVSYYYLIANNSIDALIYKALMQKQDISNAVLNMINNQEAMHVSS